MGFTKLSSTVVLSTIWAEPHHVRIIWITLLALSDSEGYVGASIPGLADIARVSLEECHEALNRLLSPDLYSRSKEYEGRRIDVVDGGWKILNYVKYRSGRDPEARRRQNREAQARRRLSAKMLTDADRVPRQPTSAQAEAEADLDPELISKDQERRGGGVGEEKAPAAPNRAGARPSPGSAKPKGARKKASVLTSWPEGFEPDETARAIAADAGLSVRSELAKAEDWAKATGKRCKDWQAFFRNWLRKAAELPRSRPAPSDPGRPKTREQINRELREISDRIEQERINHG